VRDQISAGSLQADGTLLDADINGGKNPLGFITAKGQDKTLLGHQDFTDPRRQSSQVKPFPMPETEADQRWSAATQFTDIWNTAAKNAPNPQLYYAVANPSTNPANPDPNANPAADSNSGAMAVGSVMRLAIGPDKVSKDKSPFGSSVWTPGIETDILTLPQIQPHLPEIQRLNSLPMRRTDNTNPGSLGDGAGVSLPSDDQERRSLGYAANWDDLQQTLRAQDRTPLT